VNAELHTMLSQLVTESRWDMVFLGMQLIVEGIALALFRLGHISSFDPVVKQVTELVARDEARHVTFGVVVLEELYKELTHAELADREEFVRESIELMSRRFLLTEVWERMELDPAAGKEFAANNALLADIRRLMFARVSTGLARVGVLTPSVREHLMAV
jgi:long-chain fatty aldehyde decarbonylase